jgi:hypothetical protein
MRCHSFARGSSLFTNREFSRPEGPDQSEGGVSQKRAALTIATMPAFRASGNSGQAVTVAAR